MRSAKVRGRPASIPCIKVRSKSRQLSKPSRNISVLPHVDHIGGHMLRNGNYSAWFRTRQEEGTGIMQGEGTGVIELKDGNVTGGDTVLAYTGSYVVDGDKFTAFIATQRHTPGQPSVFGIGIDDVNLTVTGKSTPTTASCTGTVKQAPGLTFEATFIRIAEQPRALPRAPTRPRSPAFVIRNPAQIARDARSKK
jgi:T3SS negative regulator,GrlR